MSGRIAEALDEEHEQDDEQNDPAHVAHPPAEAGDEPDGGRARTQESSLSDKDRDWIAEQKKMRNM